MSNGKPSLSGRIILRDSFAAIITVLCISSCGGGKGATASVTIPGPGSIAAVDAVTLATPILNTNGIPCNTANTSGCNVEYFCDCTGPGHNCAGTGVTQGTDGGNHGSSAADPQQTITAAMNFLNGGKNRSALLCQGGAFQAPVPGSGSVTFKITQNLTPAGQIYNELREYPIGGSGQKPIIINAGTSSAGYYLFGTTANANAGGYRIMNLRLQGTWDTTAKAAYAFFLYAAGVSQDHDITIANVDIDSFNLAIDDAAAIGNQNITIIGNHFTNNAQFAYLGASSNLNMTDNSLIGNGSDVVGDHAIYIASSMPISELNISNNFVEGFSSYGGNTTCNGGMLAGHGEFIDLTMSGNAWVQPAATTTAGCWGLTIINKSNAGVGYFVRGANITNNIIVNTGSTSLGVDGCTGNGTNLHTCTIANNLIIHTANIGGTAIQMPIDQACPNVATCTGRGGACNGSACADDAETGVTVVNNTIYLGTSSGSGLNGIRVGVAAYDSNEAPGDTPEGSNYIVGNNTIMYAGSSATSAINCFYYVAPANYSFVNNNNCYSAHAYNWAYEYATTTSYSLANWLIYNGNTLDTTNSSITTPAWSFTTIPPWSDNTTSTSLYARYFTPAGPPLLGLGNHANAPATDITNTARPIPPSIGAYD